MNNIIKLFPYLFVSVLFFKFVFVKPDLVDVAMLISFIGYLAYTQFELKKKRIDELEKKIETVHNGLIDQKKVLEQFSSEVNKVKLQTSVKAHNRVF